MENIFISNDQLEKLFLKQISCSKRGRLLWTRKLNVKFSWLPSSELQSQTEIPKLAIPSPPPLAKMLKWAAVCLFSSSKEETQVPLTDGSAQTHQCKTEKLETEKYLSKRMWYFSSWQSHFNFRKGTYLGIIPNQFGCFMSKSIAENSHKHKISVFLPIVINLKYNF